MQIAITPTPDEIGDFPTSDPVYKGTRETGRGRYTFVGAHHGNSSVCPARGTPTSRICCQSRVGTPQLKPEPRRPASRRGYGSLGGTSQASGPPDLLWHGRASGATHGLSPSGQRGWPGDAGGAGVCDDLSRAVGVARLAQGPALPRGGNGEYRSLWAARLSRPRRHGRGAGRAGACEAPPARAEDRPGGCRLERRAVGAWTDPSERCGLPQPSTRGAI
jgi:hypothetical protein